MSDHCCSSSNDAGNFVAGVVIGAALGALAGVLFAPAAGEHTRNQLRREGTKALRRINNTIEDIENDTINPAVARAKSGINSKVESIKRTVNKAVDDVKSRIKSD